MTQRPDPEEERRAQAARPTPPPDEGGAYTGETIVMRPHQPQSPPPPQPTERQQPRQVRIEQPAQGARIEQPPRQARIEQPARQARIEQPRQARIEQPARPDAGHRAGGARPAVPVRPPAVPRRIPRPRSRVWPAVRLALGGALVVLLIGLALVYWQVSSLAGQLVVRDVRPPAPLLSLAGGMNVLIIGVDERPDHPEEGVRSDTLMLAHLDNGGRWASLLSIPRDTLVELPQVGPAKINVAYGEGYATAQERYGTNTTPREGGMALAGQTVEQLLNLRGRGQRVDYVAQVNFDGFAAIIDALGGITIDVPKRIVDDAYPTPDFGTRRIEFLPGVQRMDGETALIYARTRHADSDFDRGARQQQVLRAIMAELRGRGPLGMALLLPRLGSGLEGTVATTLPFARPDMLASLLWLAGGLNPDEIGQVRLSPEIDPAFQQDAAFNLIWSEAGIRAALDTWLTRPSEAAEAARIQVLNGTGVGGLAGRVTGELEGAGFTVLRAADAPSTDVQRTTVYDLGGKPRTSRRLAELLNAELRQGAPEGVVTEADIVVMLGSDAVK
ncbi:MAG TPA: LCP family protein [Roseiflexaceae bacterium]|nr:LCP family protein [Roseiflexaceae bacterium]